MSTPVLPTITPAIPPLRDGERLTRAEFERRYDAMPDLKKAELIEGVVHMPSPVRTDAHGQPHVFAAHWAGTYRVATPGVIVSASGSARMDDANEPQPDVSLLRERRANGRTGLDEDGYIDGAPELAVEVSASTSNMVRNTKFRVYRDHGVREYVIWRIQDAVIDYFVLRGGQYQPLAPGDDGIIRSEAFPGLWLDPVALARQDMNRVMAVLQLGLASQEHADFVAALNPTAQG